MDRSFNPAVPYFSEVRPRKFPWVNVVLFVATCLSTLLTGTFMMMGFNQADFSEIWHPSSLLMGLPFCIAIMSILFAHEMGHYLLCRYYGIDASLPYFIPVPILSLVGTMGAFIKIRGPIRDRGSLLEVGVAGPIAGFIVAVVALMLSIGHSRIAILEPSADTILMGEPLIFKAAEYLAGMTPPPGMDVYLHPVSVAAWFGLLVGAQPSARSSTRRRTHRLCAFPASPSMDLTGRSLRADSTHDLLLCRLGVVDCAVACAQGLPSADSG